MIPVKVFQGQLFDKDGNAILPDCEGIVHITIEGKPKKFVYEKLVDYLERNVQIRKKPILKPIKQRKRSKKGFAKVRVKSGNVGHHRRKKVVFTKEGKEQKFESVVQAATELNICRSKIFDVLKGKRETFQGYKIKYAS